MVSGTTLHITRAFPPLLLLSHTEAASARMVAFSTFGHELEGMIRFGRSICKYGKSRMGEISASLLCHRGKYALSRAFSPNLILKCKFKGFFDQLMLIVLIDSDLTEF